jgi:hypothetical protein
MESARHTVTLSPEPPDLVDRLKPVLVAQGSPPIYVSRENGSLVFVSPTGEFMLRACRRRAEFRVRRLAGARRPSIAADRHRSLHADALAQSRSRDPSARGPRVLRTADYCYSCAVRLACGTWAAGLAEATDVRETGRERRRYQDGAGEGRLIAGGRRRSGSPSAGGGFG